MSPEPNAEFMRDVCDFFAGRRSGHIGTWRYSEPVFPGDKVNGMHHWGEFVKTAKAGGAYYVVNDEVETIRAIAPDLHTHIHENMTLIDMGPGSKEAIMEKVAPIIRAGHVSSYIAVDIVEECVARTKEIIATEFPALSYQGFHCDFYEETLAFSTMDTPVLLMFGQTLFNLPIDPHNTSLPDKILFERLTRFKEHMGAEGYMVITQDCNQDKDSLYQAYLAEADFDLNLLHRIKRDLPVSDTFNPDDFSFEPFWVPETGAASHTYVCKNDMRFSIGEENFELQKGQRLYMHNTYKFSASHFVDLAASAGLETIHTAYSKSGRIALHILKSA